MGRTSSISTRSMVGILSRAPAVDEKVCFLFVFCFFRHALESLRLWQRKRYEAVKFSKQLWYH